MKSENAANKLVCFSNPATNVHTAGFFINAHMGMEKKFFGGVRHVCMIFFLACMYCSLSVSDDEIFLTKFFNPHLPPFQVSNRPSLKFESVLLNEEKLIFYFQSMTVNKCLLMVSLRPSEQWSIRFLGFLSHAINLEY